METDEEIVQKCENPNCSSEYGADYDEGDLKEILDTLYRNTVLLVCPDCYILISNQNTDSIYPEIDFQDDELESNIEDYLRLRNC
ncbi:MAG: hypothetical protein Q8K30_01775 [Candidatus Gracilibacteria bacterium]|nr:hypothetical protein [Candidatus Gracilibacteria bacterium]MDP3380439.1 hypothetical protein [bacterium]